MKIQVICEKCGSITELLSMDNGNHTYVNRELIEKDMYVSEVTIEAEANGDIEDLEDISDADVTATLQEVRIDCKACGDYIVLTEFGQ